MQSFKVWVMPQASGMF